MLSQSAGWAHLSLVPEFRGRRAQPPPLAPAAPTAPFSPPSAPPPPPPPRTILLMQASPGTQEGPGVRLPRRLVAPASGLVGDSAGGSHLTPQAPLPFVCGWGRRGGHGGRTCPALCCRRWRGGERLSHRRAASVNFCAHSVPALRSSLRALHFTISAAACLWEAYDTVSVKWASHRQRA